MRLAAIAFASAMVSGYVVEAEPRVGQAQASIYEALIQCRTLADASERLKCYDGKAAALDLAQKSGEVVIADKAQLRETSKGMFGFGALRLPIIGSNSKLETPAQIEATISAARSIGYGKWELTLDNGMRWRETEPAFADPRPGDPVVIRAGALNSFFIKVRGGRGVRGLRIQ